MKKGKNMKFKVYGLAVALWALASSCGNSPKENVTVSYELLENNNPKVKECMDVEPQYAFDVTLRGKLYGVPYKLYQVHVKNGKTERTEIVQKKTCVADSVQHVLFASIQEGKDTVRIVCKHQMKNDLRIAIPGRLCILMETYLPVESTTDDAIPLIAFTEGMTKAFEIDGRKLEGLDYCGIRDAKIHPNRWFEEFNIKNYVYFEIEFE